MTPRRPVRVCLVGPSLDILGGQAIAAQRLLERLRTVPGLEVSFLPVNPRLPGPLRLLQRVKYVRTVVTSIAYISTLLWRIWRYDVLHIFSASYWSFLLAPVPAMLIGRMTGCRVILNYHSGEAADHLARFGWHVRPLLRLAHLVVVPSPYLERVFAGFGIAAQVVHNFVEVESIPFRLRSQPKPTLFSNRNLEPMYNVRAVIDAFCLIRDASSDATLLIAGDGTERASLEAHVRSLGLPGVEFTGRVTPERMMGLYAERDIYINASRIDNMPLSILEANAAGLPVVTSDAGGIPVVVEQGVSGLIVPGGDPKGLADAVLRILADSALATRLVRTAHERCVALYSWSAVEQAWMNVYGAGRAEDGTTCATAR